MNNPLYYPHDHATQRDYAAQERRDRLWRREHPWLLWSARGGALAVALGLWYVGIRLALVLWWLVWGGV